MGNTRFTQKQAECLQDYMVDIEARDLLKLSSNILVILQQRKEVTHIAVRNVMSNVESNTDEAIACINRLNDELKKLLNIPDEPFK